ncbi:hypothetical protein D4R99_03875 [bacterium]|nr:MAG: hypothetical protein D4R99_03875 [bacterium]
MNLIKIDTEEYPVSEQEFRSRFPYTSFSAQIHFPDFGYEVVFTVPKPIYDPSAQSVREITPHKTSLGNYEQRWEIISIFS